MTHIAQALLAFLHDLDCPDAAGIEGTPEFL